MGWARWLALAVCLAGMAAPARAQTGHDLWLRYTPVEAHYRSLYVVSGIVSERSSPTLDVAAAELRRGLAGMLGAAPDTLAAPRDDILVIGTPASSPQIASLHLPLAAVGSEGYLIRHVTIAGHRAVVIAANSDIGVLYGVFAYLRLIQMRRPVRDMASAPRIKLRILDHWDNLDGTVERGYAGQFHLALGDIAGACLAPDPRLCPRQCLDRHQWRGRSTM